MGFETLLPYRLVDDGEEKVGVEHRFVTVDSIFHRKFLETYESEVGKPAWYSNL